MTTPLRTPPGHSDDFEARLYEYLKRSGRLIPTTSEEVEVAEKWIAQQDIQVPEELLGLSGCALRPRKPTARILPFPAPATDIEQGLARAAREGNKQISPEVEARMKRDREQKERESKGDE